MRARRSQSRDFLFDPSDWCVSSNQAIKFALVRDEHDFALPDSSKPLFSPEFTHQIFQDETIYGYQGLEIRITFAATSMHAHISVNWRRRVSDSAAYRGPRIGEDSAALSRGEASYPTSFFGSVEAATQISAQLSSSSMPSPSRFDDDQQLQATLETAPDDVFAFLAAKFSPSSWTMNSAEFIQVLRAQSRFHPESVVSHPQVWSSPQQQPSMDRFGVCVDSFELATSTLGLARPSRPLLPIFFLRYIPSTFVLSSLERERARSCDLSIVLGQFL